MGTTTYGSMARFVAGAIEPPSGDTFDVVNERLARVTIADHAWIKHGTVVAYHGDLTFHLEPVLQPEALRVARGPIRSALKREAVPFSRAVGRGRLYLSDGRRLVRVIRLDDETIHVAAPNVLAFEGSVRHDIQTLGRVGLLSGGRLAVRLSGRGFAAISAPSEPIAIAVTPEAPISTDPAATLAWTAGLWPELKVDLDRGSIVAHGGGEPVQMRFRGDGHVIVGAKRRSRAPSGRLLSRVTSSAARLFA